jgi:hypothetical protein
MMAIATAAMPIIAPTIMSIPVTKVRITPWVIIAPVSRLIISPIIGSGIIISVVIRGRFIIAHPVATAPVMIVPTGISGRVIAIIIIAARTVTDRYITASYGRGGCAHTDNGKRGKDKIFEHRISPSTTRKRGKTAIGDDLLSMMNL